MRKINKEKKKKIKKNGENDKWHGESGKFPPLLINTGDEKKRK